MKPSDKKIFLSVIEGGLLKPASKESKSIPLTSPQQAYRENLKRLAASYQDFLKTAA